MYVCTCPSKVGMSFLLCMQTKILHIHIMFPPPPLWVGWGGSYHLQPCKGITICLYWFMYVWLCVCLSVCWYVSMCVSQQGRHVIVFVSAHKDTTCTHNVPAPPPVGGLGGSYHLQPCIGITICFYWFMYDKYLFVLIYGLFVCMYVRVQARSACHFYCVCKQRYYIYT